MRNSKLLRGICYCLIPIMIFLIAFSFFYEFYDDYSEEYEEEYYFLSEDGTYYEHYSEDGSEIISYISPNQKEFLNMLDNMTFMSYCAPVFIPVCTLLLLAMVIYLVTSIGHTKRKKRKRYK